MPLKIMLAGEELGKNSKLFSVFSQSSLCDEILFSASNKPDLIFFGNQLSSRFELADILRKESYKCIGVSKKFSQLETSRITAKIFIVNNGIMSAKLLPIEFPNFPQVIKTNELIFGKNDVKIVYSQAEKDLFTREIMPNKYFIEEFLSGEEIFLVSYAYNGRLINFRPEKIIKEENLLQETFNLELSKIQNLKLKFYLEKFEKALNKEGVDFNGLIYSGLIWAYDDWYVIQYKFSLTNLEYDILLKNLKNDFLDIIVNGIEPEY